MKKTNPKLEMFLEFFNQHGVKFVDAETGDEIKPSSQKLRKCKVCDNETPESDTKCMWCQNRMK